MPSRRSKAKGKSQARKQTTVPARNDEPLVAMQHLPTGEFVFLQEGEALQPGASLVKARRRHPGDPTTGKPILYTANQNLIQQQQVQLAPQVQPQQIIQVQPPPLPQQAQQQPPPQRRPRTTKPKRKKKSRHDAEVYIEQRQGGRHSRHGRSRHRECTCCDGPVYNDCFCGGPPMFCPPPMMPYPMYYPPPPGMFMQPPQQQPQQPATKPVTRTRKVQYDPSEMDTTTLYGDDLLSEYDDSRSGILGYFEVDVSDDKSNIGDEIRAKLNLGQVDTEYDDATETGNYVPTETGDSTAFRRTQHVTVGGDGVVTKETREVDEWSETSFDFQEDNIAAFKSVSAKDEEEQQREPTPPSIPAALAKEAVIRRRILEERARELAEREREENEELAAGGNDNMRPMTFYSGDNGEVTPARVVEYAFVQTPVFVSEKGINDPTQENIAEIEEEPTEPQQEEPIEPQQEEPSAAPAPMPPRPETPPQEEEAVTPSKLLKEETGTSVEGSEASAPFPKPVGADLDETINQMGPIWQAVLRRESEVLSSAHGSDKIIQEGDSDGDTRVRSHWTAAESASLFRQANMPEFASIIEENELTGQEILLLRDHDLRDDLGIESEEDRMGFLVFVHSPVGLPMSTWSVLQCAAWLTDHLQDAAAKEIMNTAIEGSQLLEMTSADFARIGVVSQAACDGLARKCAHQPPAGAPEGRWDANDVQAWFSQRGLVVISDLRGEDLLTYNDNDLRNLGIEDPEQRLEILNEIYPENKMHFSDWTVAQTQRWLRNHELPHLSGYVAEHGIDGQHLIDINPDDLEQNGIPAPEVRVLLMYSKNAAMMAWTTQEASDWLRSHELPTVATFFEESDLNGKDLLDVTDSELAVAGVPKDEREKFADLTLVESLEWSSEETVEFLRSHNLHNIAGMFEESNLSGGDMQVIQPSDMENIPQEEQDKFFELIAMGGDDLGRGRATDNVYYVVGDSSTTTSR